METIKTGIKSLFCSQSRISYRRLATFCAASGLLVMDKLNGDQWCYVAIAFIAGEAAPKMAAAFKGQ